MRRVVVTGMGAVTPLGCNVRNTWNALIQGKTGVKAMSFGHDLPVHAAAPVDRAYVQSQIPGDVCFLRFADAHIRGLLF